MFVGTIRKSVNLVAQTRLEILTSGHARGDPGGRQGAVSEELGRLPAGTANLGN